MYTINQLVKRFGLSRSTLLYYDKIGLLSPSARSQANYRLYSDGDIDKMTLIETYKAAGLSLDEIARLVEGQSQSQGAKGILEQRLGQLNEEISALRKQQQTILELLGNSALLKGTRVITKERWVDILRSSGMDDAAMRQWHIEFERALPEAHQDFLESLGIEPEQIAQIRQWR